MKITISKDWETIDLLTEQDPNKFGEALRNYCFIGNCEQTGCYSTFDLIPQLKKVKSGKIYEEAKKVIHPENYLHVYYWKIIEKNCWIAYGDPEGKPQRMKFCEPHELVCAWEWEGDGTLYFRFNNKKVINTDCKKDYVWKWIK
jgi:hypothetical protein